MAQSLAKAQKKITKDKSVSNKATYLEKKADAFLENNSYILSFHSDSEISVSLRYDLSMSNDCGGESGQGDDCKPSITVIKK